MIKWNEVTWYSKTLAVVLFIFIIPAWTFYIGREYEKTEEVVNYKPIYINKTSDKTGEISKVKNGRLTGHITLSPTCPVERIPPDPNCAPKPYPTLLSISGTGFYIELHADSSGMFLASLPPGNYNIMIDIKALYPRCESKKATVKSNATTTADISCDSGIR